jgi:hypothetical protein
MENMNAQMQEFVKYIQQEVMTRAQAAHSSGALVPFRKTVDQPAPKERRK